MDQGDIAVAIYCRVSTGCQEAEQTVRSQIEEIRARVREDGVVRWEEFVDEGYSRDDLNRPTLDRLRDLMGSHELDRLYVHDPDRLGSGARRMLLVEECQSFGVDIVFLRGSSSDSPEGKLLLHMQGAIAEYERTKIAERTRRGKLYWARHGAMVGGHAPYGYRLIRRADEARAPVGMTERAGGLGPQLDLRTSACGRTWAETPSASSYRLSQGIGRLNGRESR